MPRTCFSNQRTAQNNLLQVFKRSSFVVFLPVILRAFCVKKCHEQVMYPCLDNGMVRYANEIPRLNLAVKSCAHVWLVSHSVVCASGTNKFFFKTGILCLVFQRVLMLVSSRFIGYDSQWTMRPLKHNNRETLAGQLRWQVGLQWTSACVPANCRGEFDGNRKAHSLLWSAKRWKYQQTCRSKEHLTPRF